MGLAIFKETSHFSLKNSLAEYITPTKGIREIKYLREIKMEKTKSIMKYPSNRKKNIFSNVCGGYTTAKVFKPASLSSLISLKSFITTVDKSRRDKVRERIKALRFTGLTIS